MKAGEVKSYFEELETDLEATTDPELRAWYATEIALTADHTDAEKLQQLLGGFSTNLAILRERKAIEIVAVDKITQAEKIKVPSELDDEWLTPQQKRRKSIATWVSASVKQYGEEMSSAKMHTKRSRREKQMGLARRRFIRHFEQYGNDQIHILHDPEALEYALDTLRETKPGLAVQVVDSAVEYLHTHNSLREGGAEPFVSDAAAFAGIIQRTTEDYSEPTIQDFNRLLKALYEKHDYQNNIINAERMHIALAHALFAYEGDSDRIGTFYRKVVDIAYLRDETITDKMGYLSAIETRIYQLGCSGDPEIVAALIELHQAKLVFTQARFAFVEIGEVLHDEMVRQHRNLVLIERMMRQHPSPEITPKWRKIIREQNIADFLKNPQHYDKIEAFNLNSQEVVTTPTQDKEVPEVYRVAFTNSELRQKRVRGVAAKGLAHDALFTTLHSDLGVFLDGVSVHDVPISPGIVVSCVSFEPTQQGFVNREEGVKAGILKILEKHVDHLTHANVAATDVRVARFLIDRTTFTLDDSSGKALVEVLVRPSVPVDFAGVDPHCSLYSSFAKLGILQLENAGTDEEQTEADRLHSEIQAVKVNIQQNRHNLLGRRPIEFSLPPQYQAAGLQSIQMRKHPDHRRVLVAVRHDEGDIHFTFGEDFSAQHGNPALNRHSLTHLVFEKLVISLFNEWACQPVVETSEGTVRREDTKSRVNLGFLRFLAEGENFSPRQRELFKKEQGGELAVEYERFKLKDPRGQRRGCTYVREKYDPTKPPLKIYYDESVIT